MPLSFVLTKMVLMRPFLSAVLMAALFLSCAPTSQRGSASTAPKSDFHAVFSQQGVAWVSAGRACVARAPSYTVTCPRIGAAAVDVAWHDGDAWAALPQVGLVLTLDRSTRSVNAGAVVRLSSQLIYREDGTALTYGGTRGGQVVGAPTKVVTGGDGLDYVILAGQLRRVTDNALIEAAPLPELISTPTGVRSVLVPTVVTDMGSYRVNAGMLERFDPAGQILQRVPHDAAQMGLVGDDLLTVTPGGVLRRFTGNLQELPLR